MECFRRFSKLERVRRNKKKEEEQERRRKEEKQLEVERLIRIEYAISHLADKSRSDLMEMFRRDFAAGRDSIEDDIALGVLTTILASEKLDSKLESLVTEGVGQQYKLDLHYRNDSGAPGALRGESPSTLMSGLPPSVTKLRDRIEKRGGDALLLLISKRVSFVRGDYAQNSLDPTLFAPTLFQVMAATSSGLEDRRSYDGVIEQWRISSSP